jgi:hypothetical protein
MIGVVLALLASSCAQSATLVCDHCACSWQSRSASRPLRCETLGRELECCLALDSS